MTTPLQLDAYCIDRFEFAVVEKYRPQGRVIEVDVDVQPQAMVKEGDPARHQIVLDIRFKPAKPGSAPYRGRIVGRGFFRVAEDLDEQATARYVLNNGASILLGLLRAHVAQSTSLSRWGAFLIPPINLLEAFKKAAADTPEGE
ncbi:MAG: hypothetical protein QMD96_02990 [Anaerosomatales bacterium]|nr:hypothetical protein [Anaerosomatales bacterium]